MLTHPPCLPDCLPACLLWLQIQEMLAVMLGIYTSRGHTQLSQVRPENPLVAPLHETAAH